MIEERFIGVRCTRDVRVLDFLPGKGVGALGAWSEPGH